MLFYIIGKSLVQKIYQFLFLVEVSRFSDFQVAPKLLGKGEKSKFDPNWCELQKSPQSMLCYTYVL